MKKIAKFTLAACLLASASLVSCNKKLDIEPADQISAANALNTSGDIEAALIGAYTAMGSSSLYGGQIQFLSELVADNGEIQFVGTYAQPKEFFSKIILPQNSFVASTWTEAYRTINSANNVLANIGKVTSTKQDRVEGEARFIRAAMYFELVKLHGKSYNDTNGSPQANLGVPLVLTPTSVITDASNVSRNTVAEVYAQIITDLTIAEAKIPAANAPFYAATNFAAAAMLSRVYLQQGNYTAAAAAANRVIASGNYALKSSVAAEFNDPGNTSEDVFDAQVTSQSGVNDMHTYFSEQSRGDVEVQAAHLKLYEAGDARRGLFDATGVYTLKFQLQYGNVKLIRLAELYLTRAEANFRTGAVVAPGSRPVDDVNVIRARAGLKPLLLVNLAQILKERHLELAFEGSALADAKRTKLSIGTIAYNANQLVYPIPRRELDVNTNLMQNAGY